jgi:hypothetical protein
MGHYRDERDLDLLVQVEASRKPSRNRPGELMFWDKFRDTSRWLPAHGYGKRRTD